MAYTVVEALEEKKGEDILLLDIHEIAPFADYFILCSGTSDRMLDSLANAALEKVRAAHGLKGRVEGKSRSGWVLVDFGDVILHIFAPEVRDYYRLEELWAEGKVLIHLQ